MVKRFLPILILLAGNELYAQSVPQGQKLQAITASKVNMVIESFGQNIQMENTLTAEVEAKNVTDTGYIFLITTKRMQSKSNAMGQNIDLDSDRPADMEGAAGSAIKKEMDMQKEIHVNKAGKITAIVNNKFNAEPSITDAFNAAGLMGQGQPYPLLLTLPGRSLKQGDSWIDSSGTKETVKTVATYTIKSITGTDYIISSNANMSINMPIKQQGMEIKMEMSGSTKGDAVYEKKSGLLRTGTGISELKGTVGVMGQTTPMSMVSTYSLDVKKL